MAEFLADKLVKEPPFSARGQKDSLFLPALLEELRFHYDNNELYRTFCENKGFNPHEFTGNISDIPPVQVSVFKELGGQLASVPGQNIKLTLQSSATSGIPSSIPVDSITSKRQARAMIKVIVDYIGNERKPFLIMDVDPSSGFRHILGARYAAVSGYLNFASEAGYFLKVNDSGRYYFDTAGMSEFIRAAGKQSTVVFGYTYILYAEVLRPCDEQNISFCLPEGSKIIHIGGWKKLEDEKISREAFNALASKVFGIAPCDVIDIYGFTEQMGLNYPDCPCGCKHAPLYSEVIVRDIISKEVLPPGREGLLEFVSPVPHSYPGNVVLTDDIGVIEEGCCEYHRSGTRFRVLGRLKKAEIRGCGDILSSKLNFSSDKTDFHDAAVKNDFRFYCKAIGERDSLTGSSGDKISAICEALVKNLPWLRRQPVDALIGLISKIAEKWKGERLSAAQANGLNFLVSWCSGEHLAKIADDGLRGNRHFADRFIPADDFGISSLRATSRGLACHWLAGNVQVLGMFVLIQCLLTKNVNLLRISSRDDGVFESLLRAFEGEEYVTPGGYKICGDDLLKCIAAVSFSRQDKEAGRRMSQLADARIAWGGAEAVAAVSSYPSKYDCSDIIMGPKLSFSAVGSEELSDEQKARKLARKISVDASVFDQTGCASAHNVFVEQGGGYYSF